MTYGNRCKVCGSYAFNLHQEGVDQGELCDTHYWENECNERQADYNALATDYDAMLEAWKAKDLEPAPCKNCGMMQKELSEISAVLNDPRSDLSMTLPELVRGLKADYDVVRQAWSKSRGIVEAAKNLVDTSGRHNTSEAYIQLHNAVEWAK